MARATVVGECDCRMQIICMCVDGRESAHLSRVESYATCSTEVRGKKSNASFGSPPGGQHLLLVLARREIRPPPAHSVARHGDELSFSAMAKVFSSLFWWPEFYYLLRESKRNSRSLEFNGLAFHENLLGSLQLYHTSHTRCA
jgi:hypothetical protein